MKTSSCTSHDNSRIALLSVGLRSFPLLHKFFMALFLVLFLQSALISQNKYDFSQFGRETGSFITQPLRWEGSDWLKLGLMGAGTFAVMQIDQPVRDAVLKDQSYYYSAPIVGGRVWGELYMPVALFSLFGAHSLITGDMTTRKIGYEIGQASLYAGAITYILKTSVGRARPYTNEGNTSFHPFTFFTNDYNSFPGGHTTAGMVLSTVLSRNAPSTFLKILAYVPVGFTFVSRIYQDQHWTSDDFLGALVGYAVATWVVDTHEQEEGRVGISSVYPLTIRIMLN